jgi:hypothetical protein
MTELSVNMITGMMLGIEFPSAEELEEPDLKFAMVIDLLIFRIVLLSWKEEEA